MASSADTVTGEADRRCVPIRDVLIPEDFFRRTTGRQIVALRVDQDGMAVAEVGTVSHGDELLSRIAEALYLVAAEAATWSPQTRAQAMALLRHAEDELAERCDR